ncbi:MAG: helicase-exonuclease AddAB subunit AddA [Firmicutes bacterium]|nr:helicase-exonuclease AddAB subunit AddA [Bacillota bacterium]
MPNWTPEQKKAIETKDSNLLVSAAAGSGKTAVLVERIIQIITQEMIDIDKLLIVTFTNAAAGEMRERILKALVDKIQEKPENEAHLRRQLNLLNKAYITTIHSFCIEVVRRNFHLIDIDPSFRIGDNTEKNILIQESLDELMEQEYEIADDNFILLVEAFGTNREDVKLQELIYRIYTFIQSKPYPQQWLKESVEQFNMNEEEFENSLWAATIKESIKIELKGAKDIINEAIHISKSVGGPQEYEEALIDDLQNIDSLQNSLGISLENFYEDITNIKHKKFSSIRGERKLEVDANLQEEVKNLRKQYKDKIISPIQKSILTKGIDEQIQQINHMYPMMTYLYELVIKFDELYKSKKLEKGILDFNDLEHYALRILEREEVQEVFRKGFEYIFVDEYQDSNIVQETIINRIKKDNNLFLVGDVKQSIYRFRMADPTLFIEKYQSYSDDTKDKDVKVILSKNFRSRHEILEGVNYIFKNTMSKELGEIDYDEQAYLYKGLDFQPIEDPSIDVSIIEKETEDLEEIDEDIAEMTYVEVEAKVVAQKIKDLLGKETFNPKKNEYKEIEYRDIVVLLRATKNWAPIFMEAFLDEGIPVYSDDSSGYFDVIEVKVFLDLLAVIDNKRQDIPLLATMRSPIGKFTTQELIDIRLNGENRSFYEAIEKYIEEKDDALKHKLVGFVKNINRWAEEVRFVKLDDFIWRLLIETGYYHYVGAMPGGIQRQANLRILVDRAEQFEKSAINGLFNFIRFIDKLSQSGGDMSTAKTLGESENVVRLMSVHKSKGLEFPVVICPGLGKQFNLRDTHEDILLHKDLGLGPKYIDIDKRVYSETLPQVAIKRKMKIESLSEEMRILYVALTRAVDKLVLVGSIKNIEKESQKWCGKNSVYSLINGKCYFDWILSALSKHKDGDMLREIYSGDVVTNNEGEESKWNIEIVKRDEILLKEDERLKEKENYRDRLINFNREKSSEFKDIIEKRFNWSYEHDLSVKIPSKLSVTDIKKVSTKNMDSINYKTLAINDMPTFIESEHKFTNAEKGTFMHFVMQHLDFKNSDTIEKIKGQIDTMVIKELLTEEESKVINTEKILNFFQSSIGNRILNSGNYQREAPFVLRKKAREVIDGLDNCDDDLLIQGVIDCYFWEDDEIVLVDYKTDYIYDGNIERTVNRYRVQLEIYKEALEMITSKKVSESYLYLFNIDKEVKI